MMVVEAATQTEISVCEDCPRKERIISAAKKSITELQQDVSSFHSSIPPDISARSCVALADLPAEVYVTSGFHATLLHCFGSWQQVNMRSKPSRRK